MRYQPDVCPVCRNVFVENDIPAICPQCHANLGQLWLIIEEANDCLDSAKRNLLLRKYQDAVNEALKAKRYTHHVNQEADDLILEALIADKAVAKANEFVKSLDATSFLIEKYISQIEQLNHAEIKAKHHYNAGLGFARRDRLISARDELIEACKLAPWLIEPHITLAKVFLLLTQYHFADQELNYLIEKNCSLPEIMVLKQLITNNIPCVNAPSKDSTEDKYVKSILNHVSFK